MRHPLLCLLGLVCVMALALLATPAANELTPMGNTGQPLVSLAIQPAPIAVPADNVGTQNQVAMLNKGAPDIAAISLGTQSFANQSRVIYAADYTQSFQLAWRSTANDGETTAALTANFPNPFNDETKLVASLSNAEMTPTVDSALGTPTGGQPQCRAVTFVLTSPVGNFELKMAA